MTVFKREVKRTFILDGDDVREFNSRFGAHGALTEFVRKAIRNYLDLAPDPTETIKEAVRSIKL